MDVRVSMVWWASMIPPRCRKPRPVEQADETVVQVPEVTGEKAPVALRIADREYTELRWWSGRLWEPCTGYVSGEREHIKAGGPGFPPQVTRGGHGYRSREDVLNDIERSLSNRLIIDGLVWEAAREPIYLVRTFGLRHNHGGTDVMVESLYDEIDRNDLWRVDHFEQARQDAIRTADRRGDTDSIERLKSMKAPVEVLIPEAVQFQEAPRLPLELEDARVVVYVTRSPGSDGAVEVQIKTNFDPAVLPVRVLLNGDHAYGQALTRGGLVHQWRGRELTVDIGSDVTHHGTGAGS